MLSDLSELKILPDADLQFILGLEQQIVARLREPHDRALEMAKAPGAPGLALPPGAGPPVGGPPGMGPGAQMSAGMAAPGPMERGLPNVSQRRMPSPDELRRVLSQS